MSIAPSEPCPCRLTQKLYRDCCEPAVLAGGHRSYFAYAASVSYEAEGLAHGVRVAKQELKGEKRGSSFLRIRYALEIMQSCRELQSAYSFAAACEQENKLDPAQVHSAVLYRCLKDLLAIHHELSEADYRTVWGPDGLGVKHAKLASSTRRTLRPPPKGQEATNALTTHAT